MVSLEGDGEMVLLVERGERKAYERERLSKVHDLIAWLKLRMAMQSTGKGKAQLDMMVSRISSRVSRSGDLSQDAAA